MSVYLRMKPIVTCDFSRWPGLSVPPLDPSMFLFPFSNCRGGEGTYASSRYGSYDGQINIGNVMCDQSEAKIQDCQYTEYDNHADTSICSLLKHKMDIVITCNHTAYTKGEDILMLNLDLAVS